MIQFKPEQLEGLRHKLETRAAVLREEIAADALEDLNAEPEMAALQRDIEELRDVEDTLARLRQPDFGLCAECSGEIPLQRLEAAPGAKRCAACQAKFERS